jgi:hypothetical protein
MRLPIFLAVWTVFAAIASPGFAGVGRCAWEHLPQDERDRAIAPVAIPADSEHFADTFAEAISPASIDAALSACGVPADQHEAGMTSLDNYATRRWSEHWLFLYEPHVTPRQLDSAWSQVETEVKQRLAREADSSTPELRADLNMTEAQFIAALNLGSVVSNSEETALRVYILSRALGE